MALSSQEWIAEFYRRAAGTMIAAHGTRFKEVSPERAILELDFKPALSQPTGLFHAGAIIGLADEACTALAAAHTMGDGRWDPAKFPLTIQLSANLIRNTNRGRITAEAIPVHAGKTTMVMRSTVTDEDGRLLAIVTATLIVPGRQGPAGERGETGGGAPVLNGIDHVVLVVRDIERSLAFYREVLGCRVLREAEWRRGEARFPSVAIGPGQMLNLHQAGSPVTPEAGDPRVGSEDLCFVSAAPVPEVLARLAAHGVPVEIGPVARMGGRGVMATSVYFRDPDGNLLEIMAYAGALPPP